jgi:hypothetical protein
VRCDECGAGRRDGGDETGEDQAGGLEVGDEGEDAMLATAFAGSVAMAAMLLVVVGFASIIFLTTGNSTIQIAAAPAYRGRVTALWSTAFVGSTPIGATIIGAIGAARPRVALLVGAAACGARLPAPLSLSAPAENRPRPTPIVIHVEVDNPAV